DRCQRTHGFPKLSRVWFSMAASGAARRLSREAPQRDSIGLARASPRSFSAAATAPLNTASRNELMSRSEDRVHRRYNRLGNIEVDVKRLMVAVLVSLVSASLHAQWTTYPSAGIPRTADGRPNLTAPAPKDRDGRPDLSGMWGAEKTRACPANG